MHIKINFYDVLKKAYATPIYKKGDPLEAETKEQFQLLRLLQKYLKDFCSTKIILVSEKKTFERQVISLTESMNSLFEENETVVIIFLNLAKAFNSISHKFFLEELKKWI